MLAPSTFANAMPTATRAFYKMFSYFAEDGYEEEDDDAPPVVSRIFL
jgi:hypothetical protein